MASAGCVEGFSPKLTVLREAAGRTQEVHAALAIGVSRCRVWERREMREGARGRVEGQDRYLPPY